jgi:hypothetical protein
MSEHSEFPTRLAETASRDAAFPSRKAARPVTSPSQAIGNPRHDYRITVDMLEHPTGKEGLQSLSFFASTPNDILAAADNLRGRFDCSASHATKLAVGLSLIREVMHAYRDPKQLREPLLELFQSLEITAAKAEV